MDKKTLKNILLITHFLPPSHTAGTEQYTLGLGKAFQLRGYHVTLICAEGWEVGEKYWNGVSKEDYDGLTLYRVHLNWTKAEDPNLVLYDSLIVERWLDEFLSSARFDVVHVTSAVSLGVGILRSVKRAGIPLVLTLTDFWFICPSIQLLRSDGGLCDGRTTAWECHSCLMDRSHIFRRVQEIPLPDYIRSQVWNTLSHLTPVTRQRGLRGLLLDMDQRKKTMREVFSLPDVVISPSRTVKEIFSKNLPRPVVLSTHGHDLTWLREYSGKVKSDRIRFAYLGQIRMIKGVHLLIDAFVKAGIAGRARLDIWGNHASEPMYTDELKARAVAAPESIFLRGSYDRNQLAFILSNIDVVVVPSIWYENAPLVIQEAFAANTPVITTNLGGMADFVSHEKDGLLFERNNSEDLARQLKRIINEQGLLERLSSAIGNVKTIDEEVLALEKIYAHAMEQKSL